MGGSGYEPEDKAIDGVDSLDDNQLDKIKFQKKRCICKINVDDKKKGTGFFCKIPFPDRFNYLPVFITCNHVLDKDCIKQGKIINFTLDDDKIAKSITIKEPRKFYTSIQKEKDITIIEIKLKEDNIEANSFLEVDENIYNDDLTNTYIKEKKTVYLIHYEDGKVKKQSLGLIKNIATDQFNIKHNCTTKGGSSGGPIINLENLKVMGIHKGADKNKSLNCGTLLKIPIDEFNKLNYDSNKIFSPIIFPPNNSLQSNDSIIKDEPIIEKVLSNEPEKGYFYVSNIELLKINYKFSVL